MSASRDAGRVPRQGASDTQEAKIVAPSYALRAKVGRAGGLDIESIVAGAEAELKGLRGEARDWLTQGVAALEAALEAARAAVPPPTPEHMVAINNLAHDIKGQGATFGYPLLTTLGQGLCRFLDRDPVLAAQHMDLVAAYVGAMRLIVTRDLRDDGGKAEHELVATLELASERFLNRR